MMLKDHGDAEQKLLALAKNRGIALPPAATGGVKPGLLLTSVSTNFDKNYVHVMVAGHGNTVQTFENYAVTGKDPAVRAWAQQMLPTLKMHLEHIQKINDSLK
jgi:putative membrane protein